MKSAGGLLAAGAHEEVRRVLLYLKSTQHTDGHWPQNMWLDGSPYWDGIQMDETALPILLVSLALRREGALAEADVESSFGRWFAARPDISFAMVRSRRKTGGKKIPATLPLP